MRYIKLGNGKKTLWGEVFKKFPKLEAFFDSNHPDNYHVEDLVQYAFELGQREGRGEGDDE